MKRNLVMVAVCCVMAACIWGLVHCRHSDTVLRPDVQPHQAANAGGGSDSASSGPVRSIRIVLEGEGDPILRGIADVCVRQVQSRCDAKVALTGEAPLTIEFKTQSGIGAEGFRIEDGGRGVVRIVGNDPRGVLYGLGKFLRTSRYDQGGFTPGGWRGKSVPIKPVRGIYFATHFHNFYHVAPVEDVQHYIEDLGLWGINSVAVWFDMHEFKGFDDPDTIEFRKRIDAFAHAAHRVGMGFAFLVVANEAYNNSPKALRAEPCRSCGYDCLICPSKPGGKEHLLQNFGQLFDWFATLHPEYFCVWPYDPGGCGCPLCRPWGANGYLKIAPPVAELARRKMPGAKIIVSTWFFDDTDWKGLEKHFSEIHPWADYILSGGGVPQRVPGGLPWIGFPEISMFNMSPWGGFGANPAPARFQQEWDGVKANTSGGYPYSEGIYEDINKVIFSQFYWSNQPAMETVKEYASFEFGPEAATAVVSIVETLECNHRIRQWPAATPGWGHYPTTAPATQDAGADEAYETLKALDAKLTSQARKSWRWRVLYLRGLLDAELKGNSGRPNERCEEAFAELIDIYHAYGPPLDGNWKKP